MIKLIDIINEVGEGTAAPYKWKRTQQEEGGYPIYVFKTEGENPLTYEVFIIDDTYNKEKEIELNVTFGVSHYDTFDYKVETNRGEQYRIMATVSQVVRNEIELHRKKKQRVTQISFTPIKIDDKDHRREKFYLAYIKKVFPNANVSSSKNRDGEEAVNVTNKAGF